MKPQTLKGFRDFLPLEARKRQYLTDKLRTVFERFGFEPLETPTLEYEDILMGKYGEEGDKLIYRFTDHGERRVAMRYDQTVPLARVIAQYQNQIVLPFKRYQMQPVWRAENPQRGRFREFLQCDIDTVGSNSPLADAETIVVVIEALKELGFKNFRMLVNDRKIFGDLPPQAIAIIDKLKKVGKKKVAEELLTKGFAVSALDQVSQAKPTETISNVLSLVHTLTGSTDLLVFEPTLARGLDYYTGIIIETEITGYEVGSVGGGGRYDNLIGLFAGRSIPAVGFAFGFDRIIEAMDQMDLFPKEVNTTKSILITQMKNLTNDSLALAAKLRSKNIDTEIFFDENASLDKQLKYADKKGTPFVLIIGEDEKKKNMVTVKNMKTREQQTVILEDAIKIIQNAS